MDFDRLESRLAPSVDILTYHGDNARDGWNSNETTLTPGNVTPGSFGEVGFTPWANSNNEAVYAQPLYMPGVNITGGSFPGTHNVVYVATENDDVYAVDANNPGEILWNAQLGTPLSFSQVSNSTIPSNIGITSTPTIGTYQSAAVIFVVDATVTKLNNLNNNTSYQYAYYLNAIDTTSGGVLASVKIASDTGSVNGSNGTYTVDSGGPVVGSLHFDALKEEQRAGLLVNPQLSGGQPDGATDIEIAFASYGDSLPYNGWVLHYQYTYSTHSFATFSSSHDAYVDTQNGSQAGIWMSGGAPAADANGNFYVSTGNGTAGDGVDLGESVIRFAQSSPNAASSYFTPNSYGLLNWTDWDLGSGGVVVLPVTPSGESPNSGELVEAGKEGEIYVLNASGGPLGGYNASGDQVLQELPVGTSGLGAVFSTPAYANGRLYYGAGNDVLRAFGVSPTTGQLTTTPVAQSSTRVTGEGATPTISSNGASNGIVWVVNHYLRNNQLYGVLQAYDANTLSLLYDSSLDGVSPYETVNFAVPTVADGHVFVATQDGLEVFGLKPAPTSAPALPPSSLQASPVSGSQVNLSWTNNPGADDSGGFAGAGGLTLNGSAVVSGSNLQLTDGTVPGSGGEAGSAFTSTQVGVTAFTTQFAVQFQQGSSSQLGNGLTFALQGTSPSALGGAGGSYGYLTINKSVAIKFDVLDNFTTLYTTDQNGNVSQPYQKNLAGTGITLNNGDTYEVSIAYDGTTLSWTIEDVNSSNHQALVGTSLTMSYNVNITSFTGNTAYAGFTAGTGSSDAVQDVLNWKYTPIDSLTGFQIQQSTNGGTTYTTIATVGPNVTSYPVNNLSALTNYVYRVLAYNSIGSTSSNAASVTPFAANYSSGFAGASNLTVNGTATVNGSKLQLTDGTVPGSGGEAGSAFTSSKVDVTHFTSQFAVQFQQGSSSQLGNGLTFALQGTSPSALGGTGGSYGYLTINKSVAIKFDVLDNFTTLYTTDQNGNVSQPYQKNLAGTGITLNNGDLFNVVVTYDGSTLSWTITDDSAGFPNYGQSQTMKTAVNIASLTGSTAYAGFTAGTGSSDAVQSVLGWQYTPSTSVDYSNGFGTTTGLTLNSNGSAKATQNVLQLTDGSATVNGEATSVFASAPVNVNQFNTQFSFQLNRANGTSNLDEGITFVIQNRGLNSVGLGEGLLGYSSSDAIGGVYNSIAVKFDDLSNLGGTLPPGVTQGESSDSTGLFINATDPTVSFAGEGQYVDLTSTGIQLGSGDVFNVAMGYDGTTLTVTITDATPGAHYGQSATQSYAVNIPSIVGSNTAYVGFTGGTDHTTTADSSTQVIKSWVFSPNAAINYPYDLTKAAGIATNGSAKLMGPVLQLTDGTVPSSGGEAGSAFTSSKVDVTHFTSQFTIHFQQGSSSQQGNGLVFALQGTSPSALGGAGGSYGYLTINKSVGIKFDVFDNFTTLYTTDQNGNVSQPYQKNLAGTGITLSDGDLFNVSVTYDGSTLSWTITDATPGAHYGQSASSSTSVNIASFTGNTAYAGFTAGTGSSDSLQDVLNWTYTPTTTLNFASGFSGASGLSENGSATVNGNNLQLNDTSNPTGNEAGSAFSSARVDVSHFRTQFSFQLLKNGNNPLSNGITFAIQGVASTALGGAGNALGYAGIGNSIAVKFDTSNDPGGDSIGILYDGVIAANSYKDLSGSGINLQSGDVFNVGISYDGTTLSITIVDVTTGATSAQSYLVDIPSFIGGTTAYVGFTGGNTQAGSTQSIRNWTYTPTSGSPL